MSKKAVLTILLILINLSVIAGNRFKLVIDAGHGGHDTGAQGACSMEKDINLRVALAFGQYVEQNCKDVDVIYTRKTDVFIPLKTRASIANKNNADLFVSVHTNALPNGRIAHGFEVYTLGMHRAKDNLDVAMRENSVIEEEDNYKQTYQGFDPKSSESYIMFEFMQSANMQRSVELAKMIENSVCSAADRNNMGVHQAGFLVLRETSMPSCLIELGFITTPDEEEFLDSDAGVDKMANGIYNAFVEYKNKYHNRTSGKADSIAVRDSNRSDSSNASLTPARKAMPVVPDTPSSKVDAVRTPSKKQTPETTRKTQPKAEKPEVPSVKKVQPAKTVKDETSKSRAASPKPKTEPVKPKAETQKPKGEPVKPKTEVNKPKTQPAKAQVSADLPVFKVQVFAVARKLQPNDPLLKGRKDVSTLQTAGSSLTKYTIGASNDYNEIIKLRDTLRTDFPQAYIIALKDGKPMNLSQAIIEYKKYNSKHRKK
jgi:N-acetylmuramoyl-L-alanine amidase